MKDVCYFYPFSTPYFLSTTTTTSVQICRPCPSGSLQFFKLLYYPLVKLYLITKNINRFHFMLCIYICQGIKSIEPKKFLIFIDNIKTKLYNIIFVKLSLKFQKNHSFLQMSAFVFRPLPVRKRTLFANLPRPQLEDVRCSCSNMIRERSMTVYPKGSV